MNNIPVPSAYTEGQTISTRSLKLLAGRSTYFAASVRAYANLWTPENPTGWLPLAIAENKLCTDMFIDKLATVDSLYPEWVMHYNTPRGISSLRKAFATLMQETFLEGRAVESGNICISSACSGILDNLFYLIADPGQSVLIPAPYYPSFDNDLEARNNLKPWGIHLDLEGDLYAQLDATTAAAAAAGYPVAALLITNPNNPLGIVYSESVVRDMLSWCLKNKVHYVSDEVYALSVFKSTTKFTSTLNILPDFLPETNNNPRNPNNPVPAHLMSDQATIDAYVHLVYGISKDWGAAGLALGLLYTRNADLNKALGCLVSFNAVSNQTQYALAEIFSDIAWAKDFVVKNVKHLEGSYDALTHALHEEGIPFVPGSAGVFVWLDLSEWLLEKTWEEELALWKRLVYEGNVVLTPGRDCHAAEPGQFRLCFAQVPTEALPVAVKRIKGVLDTQGNTA